MKLMGLQKLTLLDYPEHVAATVFTGGCQLDCSFCHNSELIPVPASGDIDEEEFFAFLKKRQGLLDGVCVSGGEPLVQNDIEQFLERIKEMGYLVKLDTNGGFPKKLAALIDDSLVDYVAMDIKNSLEKYPLTCGLPHLDVTPYVESRNLLLEGRVDYEFRTTIVKNYHSIEDMNQLAQEIKGAKRYFLQAYVWRDQVRDDALAAYDEVGMQKLLEAVQKHLPLAQMRGM